MDARIKCRYLQHAGRPSDVRALTKLLIQALAVLEIQSAGARRSRVTTFALQNYDAPAKNKQNKQEPPMKPGRRHRKSTSTVYLERLESSEVMSLKGSGIRANMTASQYNRKNSAPGWPAEMQQEQRVPRHGREIRGCGWYRTTVNRHRKGGLEMGSLWSYVGPQSATE